MHKRAGCQPGPCFSQTTPAAGTLVGAHDDVYVAVRVVILDPMSSSVRGSSPTFVRLPRTQAAIAYAERMHAGQRRADGTPFILHPLEVASLLDYAGAPDHLIAAGALHDLLEKTTAGEHDLRRQFGIQITRLVLAVSDDERIATYAKRKAALRRQAAVAGEEALMLFAADKLAKVRELRRELAVDPRSAGSTSRRRELRTRRLKHYRRSLALLEERLPDSPLVRELRDELHALRTGKRRMLGFGGDSEDMRDEVRVHTHLFRAILP